MDVTMPKLSDTMEEGKILRWLKHPGDTIRPGDVLAEVETDKANMELEAYDEGVLAELKVAEGESAPVGAVIAVLSGPGEGAAPTPKPVPPKAGAPKPATPSGAARPVPAASTRRAIVRPAEPPPAPPPAAPALARPAEGGVRASPLARRVAREHGLDLRGLRGSGPGGRIVERDVEVALAGRGGGAAPAAAPRAMAAAAVPAPAAGRVELSKMRRTTARRMAEAKRDVPHFYASAEIAMDEAVRLKTRLAGLGGAWEGITYTHLLVKAAGLALQRVPEMNASWDEDAVVLHGAVNVGVATATDDGLIVPVVRAADRTPLAALVGTVRALVERARTRRFAADDLSGATFTISNLGMFPVADFAAILNPPQAGILAVGAVREVPVVRDGRIVPGHVMTVTLSCDHRAVDGAIAGRFLRELKALLEEPLALVV